MKVKTQPGEICPFENKHREYITDSEKGVDVPDTEYYRRLVTEGSLVEIPPVPPFIKGGDKKEAK